MKIKRLGLETRHGLKAHLFLLPFYIGFIVFFLQPLLDSFLMTFQDVTMSVDGYITTFTGLENLRYVFTKDPKYLENLTLSLSEFAWKVPVILVASFFFAMLLNRKFKGRTFVRAVFFLPVIIASGVAITIVQGDYIAGNVLSGNSVSEGLVSQSTALRDILLASGLSSNIVSTVTTITDSMFSSIWQTGIQTIIFLAGLQSISPSLYEASSVEGATAWDDFLNITLPMMVPMMMVNIIYSVIDYMTSPSNVVMKMVLSATEISRMSWASAMAWVYFLIITVILGVVLGLFFLITKKTR